MTDGVKVVEGWRLPKQNVGCNAGYLFSGESRTVVHVYLIDKEMF